jgi:hypothetical protein
MTFNKSFKQSIAIHCIRHEHDLNHTKKSVGCRKEAALPQTDCMFEIYKNSHIKYATYKNTCGCVEIIATLTA